MIRQICERGIYIESCPTSNLVVAGLKTPPLTTFLADCPDNVTLASDDPAIFNAWPNDEFRRHVPRPEDHTRLIENSRLATFL